MTTESHHLSLIGIIHTAISLLPLAAGLYGFARYRAIRAASRSGQLYLVGLVLSVVTSFGLSSTGGFNPGHALGILALLAAFSCLIIPRLAFLGKLRPYAATFGLTFSFFLLGLPGINETLTRVPPAHPLATGPQSPVVLTALLAWLAAFVVGFALQAWHIRSHRRSQAASSQTAKMTLIN